MRSLLTRLNCDGITVTPAHSHFDMHALELFPKSIVNGPHSNPMHRILLPLALCMLALCRIAAAGDLVVIANPTSGIDHLTREETIDLYMGRNRKLPTGATSLPIDLGGDGKEREQFYFLLVKKDLSQINSYWARLVFSGKATPPFQAPDMRTAVDLVATNPNAIAYVDRTAVDNRVKVVLEIKR